MESPELTPTEVQKPQWSEAGLAALLLRLLGVYFTSVAVILLVDMATRLFVGFRQFGFDSVMSEFWPRLVSPVFELVVGLYLLIGGQWVYEKLLTPIARNSSQGTEKE